MLMREYSRVNLVFFQIYRAYRARDSGDIESEARSVTLINGLVRHIDQFQFITDETLRLSFV